ncbi:MAG: S8 family serine peptidase [Candidatus Aenigmarchaeota archaeon]|nr:S8 family serine peptidase [Candidatus Aenigmarchaeota archaeon]
MRKIVLIFIVFFVFVILAQSNKVYTADARNDVITVIVESENIKSTDQTFLLGNFHKVKIQRKDLKNIERSWQEKEYRLLLDGSVPLVNVSSLWNSSYNGSGIKICILDTGINKTHPAFGSRVMAEKDFVTDDSDGNSTMDFHGHGTHVAGIAASEDSTYRGIAYGALLLNAKVFSSTTTTATDTNIMNGIDWCIQQGADVLSMSFGGAGTSDDLISAYVDLAADAGKIVVIAAGNSGPNGDLNCGTHEDGSSSVCSPGLAHKVITVGSTKKDDSISSFSSRGPTDDERIKPDLTAPGQAITSANRNGGWVSFSGTSMSTPMVAGFAAVIKQAKPEITPEELKALIMNTALDLGTSGKDNVYGAGRISGTNIMPQINNTIRDNITVSDFAYIISPLSDTIKSTLYWPEDYSLHNNLDFYLIDPYGNFVSNSTSVNNTDEIIKYNNTNSSGRWKILVRPKTVNSSQVYAIASNNPIGDRLYTRFGTADQKTSYFTVNITNNSLSLIMDFDYMNNDLDIRAFTNTAETLSTTNSSENITLSNLTSGSWTIQIKNKGNSSVSYFIGSDNAISENFTDTTPPNITIYYLINKTYNNETLNLTFSSIDDISKNSTCNATLDSTSFFETTGIYFFQFINITQGSHTIFVYCTDDDNNIASKNISFTVDTSLRIELNSPTPNNEIYYFSNSVTINTSVEDLDTLTLEWNGTNETVPGNTLNRIIVKNNLDDGNYTFRLYANDSSGQKNVSQTRWVVVNVLRNKENIINNLENVFELLNSTGSAANKSRLLSFEKYKIKFNVSSIIVNIFDFLGNDINGTLNTTQNITLPFKNIASEKVWVDFDLVEKGKYNASIYFTNAGRIFFHLNGTKDNFTYSRIMNTCDNNRSNLPCINSSSVYLPSFSGAAAVLDTQAPELVINSPASTTYTLTSVQLLYNAGDNMELDTCWYSLNGIISTIGSCGNITLTAASGSNTFTLYANDSSGNTNQTSISFTVSLPSSTPSSSSSSSSSAGSSGSSSSDAQYVPVTTPQPIIEPEQTKNTTIAKEEPAKPVVIESSQEIPTEQTENETKPEKGANVPTGFATESNANYIIGLAVFAFVVLGGLTYYSYSRRR